MPCICCVYTIHILTICFVRDMTWSQPPRSQYYAPEAATFSVSGQAADQARQHPPVEYVYSCSHPLLQLLPQKLAEWIANNYAAELNVPPRPDQSRPWSTATLNQILQTCIVSDPRGINIYTFQSVEFETDLYCWVMSAWCCPFNMEHHQFWGSNVKVNTYTWYMYCILRAYAGHIHGIYMYWPDCAHCLATIPPYPFYIGECYNNYDIAESLFDLDSIPTLYIWRVEDLLGRVPLIPCCLDGNATSTIPHKYSRQQKDAFECCCADGAGPTTRRGSHVYEINTWLWNFGRPQPRVGGLSVAKTKKIRRKSLSEASKRGSAT